MITIRNIQNTPHRIDLRRVVLKVGSAVIADPHGGPVDAVAMASLADAVATLRERDVEVVVVSSGAVGIGRSLFPEFTPKTIPDRQALAALGQTGLMHTYKESFNARGFRAAQVLLTRDDMDDRRRYLNARYTLDRLLALGAVPVVNENDTVTIEELQFGDNDALSALIAAKMDADALIMLSIVDGFYPDDPKHIDADAEPMAVVERIDAAAFEMAGDSVSTHGTGGMTTKLRAADMAARAGVHTILVGGKTPGIVEQVLDGRFRGTYFPPHAERRYSSRQRWLAFGRKASGRRVVIDDGARRALVEGKKSLLAAGVCGVEGRFEPGDLVEVVGPDGRAVARGLVNYGADELARIQGRRTTEIRKILGELRYREVIHRDNMAMVD